MMKLDRSKKIIAVVLGGLVLIALLGAAKKFEGLPQTFSNFARSLLRAAAIAAAAVLGGAMLGLSAIPLALVAATAVVGSGLWNHVAVVTGAPPLNLPGTGNGDGDGSGSFPRTPEACLAAGGYWSAENKTCVLISR